MNVLIKNSVFVIVVFFSFGQLFGQTSLGSTEELLKQVSQSHFRSKKSFALISDKNTPIEINISNYYYENGQLSITGSANQSKNSSVILKGTKEALYGFVVMPDKNIAYEYTTRLGGNVIVNEVPLSKIIPVCQLHKESANKANGQHQEIYQHCTHTKRSYNKENKTISTQPLDEPHIGEYPAGTDVRKLQSRPGSKKVYYMDITRVMNEDTPKHMSKAEMWKTWQIFASSLSMYDVNVTTDASVYAATPVVNSGILRFWDQDGRSNAFINSFGTTRYSNMYRERSGHNYGRTTAHEAGHQLGLHHDGSPAGEYYNGISAYQWAPIMGNNYAGSNRWREGLFQWNKGEYSSSNNNQDDLRLISRYLTFRKDDILEDKAIEFTGASDVDPMLNGGQIGGNNDTDVFTFSVGSSGGRADLRVNRAEIMGGGMLDVEATLYDDKGNVIVRSNANVARHADIKEDLVAGNYKLEISGGAEGSPSNGFSNYSSMGFYEISGTIVGGINNNINNSITLSGPADFCENKSLTLEGFNDSNYSYQWYKNDEPISQATSVTYKPVTSGAYYLAISDGTLSSNSKIVNVTVKDVPSLPSVPDKTFCEPGEQVEITATGSGGVLNWFESASSEVILHTGNTYSVNLTETSSYFVEEISINPKKSVGPTDNIFGEGGSHAGDYYLIFTAEKDLTIHSVKVYAIGSGDRKFVLKNNSDVELESKIINLADGESRAALNFNVPVGSGYQLGIEKIGGSNVNMYRTSEGANYPYEIDELVSITGSSANTEGYYYYCYDWEVQEVGEGCSGPRKEVKVVLDPCLSTEEIKEADKVGIYPNPASEMIHIALVKYTEIQHISLRSITGKMVFKSIGSINSIDISGYAKGAYFLQITTNENTIVKKVLIK